MSRSPQHLIHIFLTPLKSQPHSHSCRASQPWTQQKSLLREDRSCLYKARPGSTDSDFLNWGVTPQWCGDRNKNLPASFTRNLGACALGENPHQSEISSDAASNLPYASFLSPRRVPHTHLSLQCHFSPFSAYQMSSLREPRWASLAPKRCIWKKPFFLSSCSQYIQFPLSQAFREICLDYC